MSTRFDDARALVDEAKKQLATVKREYEASLHEKEVKASLRVAVKNLVENLRSALDYCAAELHSRHGKKGGHGRIYFPIASKGAKPTEFKSLAEKKIPGISAQAALLSVLESYQAFTRSENDWLPDLATLANENKHIALTPQVRHETVRISATSRVGGGSVSWTQGSVRFGPGVYINGVPVDPSTQLPVPSPTQDVTREIWVSFELTSVGRSAVSFLDQAIAGVEGILKDLRRKA